ncbi:hypothetical protein DFA_01925 [Cavenderia fasciculata]|uniref:Uncharacterized protein n=1 Tax=Cavenderia fasciculata TaxID=261658 RepID=F4PQS8_CACFS|nr:uncharacterized protein DFA_01925 [Cavenderia fasciculata]EGG22036.1 hypothetical protein DFA_01925 [Cavenderia fasciculata]|eukprot:XP_004359887.1 hypothetical protein DFA_01925 [Cavenderia fasciculata]
MKIQITLLLTLLSIIGYVQCQPQYLQFLWESPYYDITFGAISLADGSINANFTVPNQEEEILYGFLTTQAQDDRGTFLMLTSNQNNEMSVTAFTPNNYTISDLYQSGSTFLFDFTFQPIYWDTENEIAYIAGVRSSGIPAIALLTFGFGQNANAEPIVLVQPNTKGSNIAPVGSYDPSTNSFYVYFSSQDKSQTMVKYSFASQTVTNQTLQGTVNKFIGITQLYAYNGQLFVCRSVYKHGAEILLVDFETGAMKPVYNNKTSKPSLKGSNSVQPFVFDPVTGTITILNVIGSKLHYDILDLTSFTVTTAVIPNNLPSETFIIAAYQPQ